LAPLLAAASLSSLALLAAGCGGREEAASVNPATLTKDQRMKMIDGDASLTPAQKEEKRRQVEQLEQQTAAARSMAPGMDAPPGLKRR
jgi:hypothetical protein